MAKEKRDDSFYCRICHNERFKVMHGVGYMCCGCSVIFARPDQFSLTPEQKASRERARTKIEELSQINIGNKRYTHEEIYRSHLKDG